MSVIVAVKFKNGVVIGADKQSTNGSMKEECTKVFKYKYSNTAIGGSGVLSDIQLLQYQDEILDYKDIVLGTCIDKKYVYKVFCKHIKELFKGDGRLHSGVPETIDSHFTFVTKNKIFDIGRDFSVTECEKFSTNGCGSDLASGYLEKQLDETEIASIDKKMAVDMVEEAITIACRNNIYVGVGVDIIVLEEDE